MGENGGFLQVSGITFTVDTSVESSVVLDDNGMFVSCGDARRVKDVRVVLTYIMEELGGTVDSTYAGPQGRIRIE